MSTLWAAAEAAAATGGQALGAWAATGVSIDSRSLVPGDLFVALEAARDGHDFVADALARGAAAAMVARRPEGLAPGAPLLLVDDTLAGLGALGAAGRARTGARVLALTGSSGKTTAKEMVRAMASGQGSVHAAEGSFNNHWGVPLTLARLPREAENAVIEIGMNHPGEIAPLARLARPDMALVTTLGSAHLEAFADGLDGIAHEKAALFAGLAPGGVAVIPGDLERTPILERAARAAGARVVRFGAGDGCDWCIVERAETGEAQIVTIAAPAHGRVHLRLHAPGRHMALTALGALAAGVELGLDLARALADLGRWAPVAGRGVRRQVAIDRGAGPATVELIDDAYNANPESVAAALDVLAAARPGPGGRRVAILGDMLELGERQSALHRALAELPAMAAIDVLHLAGPRMAALRDALPADRRGEWHEDADTLAAGVHGVLRPGDVVLVKGSKASGVARVVDAIVKLGDCGASRG